MFWSEIIVIYSETSLLHAQARACLSKGYIRTLCWNGHYKFPFIIWRFYPSLTGILSNDMSFINLSDFSVYSQSKPYSLNFLTSFLTYASINSFHLTRQFRPYGMVLVALPPHFLRPFVANHFKVFSTHMVSNFVLLSVLESDPVKSLFSLLAKKDSEGHPWHPSGCAYIQYCLCFPFLVAFDIM